MFIDLSIKNFGPFKDRVVFSLESTSLDGNEANLIEDYPHPDPLLSSAAIFGANASGKSYVLKAIETLQIMVRTPMTPDVIYPWYQPFRASMDTLDKPTELGIRFIKDDVKYDYLIAFTKNRVVSESLYHYPCKRRALVFERTEQEFEFGRSVAKGLRLSSTMTPPTSSFLAVAAQFNNAACILAHSGIVNDILILGDNPSELLNQVVEFMNSHPGSKAHVIDALKIADLDISDVFGTVTERNTAKPGNQLPPQTIGPIMATEDTGIAQTMLYMEHDLENSDVGQDLLRYPSSIESNGTIRLLCLMGPIIDALENGLTIVIDEFGTFLHPDISKWIIRQFRSTANPNKAQLIVSTHDQSLMSYEILRPDQIWFTEKDPATGASDLYALSDFDGIGPDIDLQKTYSIGKFGAKPFVLNRDIMD
ncbi:MAG: ATP-binding protein [archaeon]|nr:ATP-binding protein [archaeon]